jgi:type IV secretory pathway VirJ component
MRCAFIFIFISLFAGSRANTFKKDSLNWDVFGKVRIYIPEESPTSVILFISGDGGWDKTTSYISQQLVNENTLVVGIDFVSYMEGIKKKKATCFYPAGDLENCSFYIQRKYKLKKYNKPVLVGYSAGTTLIYSAIAQAPDNTFQGGIALSFSPELESPKPLCPYTGLKSHLSKNKKEYTLEPVSNLNTTFIVLQGLNDKVCTFDKTNTFFKGTENVQLIALRNVAHSFSNPDFWSAKFVDAFKKILNIQEYSKIKESQNEIIKTSPVNSLPQGLPVTYIPTSLKVNRPMAVMISGDGGWTSFDQSVAEQLSARGIPAVGFDSQKYFWDEKTPDQTSEDINKVIHHFMQEWKRNSFILIGYSFGADIVPFISSRLNNNIKENCKGNFLLSPDVLGDFEIHISDMLSMGISNNKYNVSNEVKLNKQFKTFCFFGSEEDQSENYKFKQAGAKIIVLPGPHHYNNNYPVIADSITKFIPL